MALSFFNTLLYFIFFICQTDIRQKMSNILDYIQPRDEKKTIDDVLMVGAADFRDILTIPRNTDLKR